MFDSKQDKINFSRMEENYLNPDYNPYRHAVNEDLEEDHLGWVVSPLIS